MTTAGFQGEDAVQRVKEAASIVEVIGEHVTLKRAGANLKGLCPFHSEKTPSFTVNPQRNVYHCFGCGEGGDVIRFMMNFHRMTFPEALKELARRYQVALPEKPLSPQELEKSRRREAIHLANEKAAELFHRFLLEDVGAQGARDYLEGRGISPEIIESFRLGFAPESWNFLGRRLRTLAVEESAAKEAGLLVQKDHGGCYDRFRNRITFPIFSLNGRIVGFGGRALGDGQPKYLNSPESLVFDKGRTLYGLYQNREEIRRAKSCILVEGNFDLLSLVQRGVKNVVAPLGTALTAAHLRSLKGYTDEVLLFFDGDQAGLKAAMRAVPLFLAERLSARIAVLPAAHDPDSFIREFGKDGLLRHLEQAMPLPEFVFERLAAEHGLTVSGKARIVEALHELIGTMGNRHLERTIFASHFAKKLGIEVGHLLVGKIPESEAQHDSGSGLKKSLGSAEQTTLPMKQRQLLEFLVLHPRYLPSFLEAGIEEIVVTPFGLALLALLRHHADPAGGPELLLDFATGPERPFISRLLADAPLQDDEVCEAMASEMLAWLRLNVLKARNRRLIEQIDQAHRSEADWSTLIMEKKQVDAEISS